MRRIPPLDLVTAEAMSVYSVSVITFDPHVADLVRGWAERFPGIAVSVSGTHNVEIMDAQGTKAHSLAALCDRMGIPLADVAAVGDSMNDLEMVREAGLGIAMGNAMEALKAASDVVVAPQAEGGFRQAVALALATR